MHLSRSEYSLPLLAILFLRCPLQGSESPRAVLPAPAFNFGKVLQGAVVENAFVVRNEGSLPLRIQGVRMTAPLEIERSRAQVEPGAETEIRFRLDTAGLKGPFEGEILVSLNDPEQPEVTLTFQGLVHEEIEVAPQSAFWIAAQKGEERSSELEIINHGAAPLRIEKVDHPKERFRTRLDTIEDGRRFRLTLTLDRAAPAGKSREHISIRTDSKKMPVLKVAANLNVRERIYTFPDAVDLGALSMSQIEKNPEALEGLAQTLMIYQLGGTDFKVELHTDIAFLDLKAERGPKGDRYQARVSLIPGAIRPGRLEGSIYVETNDPDFPVLEVPVTGQILEPPSR